MKLFVNTLFFLFLSKKNKKGEAPLYCRLTYNGKRKQFSTGIKVPMISWHQKKQKVKENHILSSLYNQSIQDLHLRINTIQNDILKSGESFSLDIIMERLSSKDDTKIETLMKAYAYREERMTKLIGIDYQL